MIFILPVLTLITFFVLLFLKGNTVRSFLLFVLSFLPFMDLKVSIEAWGGFKTFDVLCFYAVFFFLKDFITVNTQTRNNFSFFLFFIFCVILLLGGMSSEFPGRVYFNLLKTLPIFIFCRFFMCECFKDPSFFPLAMRALKFSYIFALCFLFLQRIIGLGFTFYPQLAPNTIDPIFHMVRYPGIFYDSQASGQYLAIGSFLFLYHEDNASRRVRISSYIIFALSIAAIFLAGSRAALGGFIIGGLVVFFMAAKQYRVYAGIIGILAAIVFLSVSPQKGIFERNKNLSEDYLFRKSIWEEAYVIAKNHPFLGIGSGNYQNYVIRHAQNQYLELDEGELLYFSQPENGYLKILVEMGFIGFGVFMLLIFSPLVTASILYLRNGVDNRLAFFMASLISWIIAFNTVYSIWDYRLLIMVGSMVVIITYYPVREYYLNETIHAN